jgi:hypothetical protein
MDTYDGEGAASLISFHTPPFSLQQTCAVCLEDFKGKDELGVLPCQHAFHRKYVGMWKRLISIF